MQTDWTNDHVRQVWNIEKNHAICDNQYDFGKHKSALVWLYSYIKIVLARKELNGAAFFDLEKDEDITWRMVILFKMMWIDFKANHPIFIQKFLSDRNLKVKIGNSVSNQFPQYEGSFKGVFWAAPCFPWQ